MYFVKKISEGRLLRGGDITEYISKCKDGVYSVEIKKFGDRSNGQNRYLRGVIYKAISEQTGNSPEEIHYFLKHKLLGMDSNGFPSTKELNVDEFQKYIDDIRNLMGELGYYIPDM